MNAVDFARVSRRLAVEADVQFLLGLRQRTMTPHMHASGVEVSDDEHLRRVRYRFDCAEIVLFDGRPAGLLKVVREGTAWDLVQIQLAPDLQGKGIGAWLIEGVLADARRACATVELDVVKTNPARRLYERLGFVVIREREHAFDMRFTPDDRRVENRTAVPAA